MQHNEPLGQSGLLFGQPSELRRVEGFRKQRIGIGLAQRRQPGLALTRPNLAPIERKGSRQPLHQRRSQRPVIMLQLRQVRSGYPQQLAHRRLIKPPLRAQRL